MNIKEEKGIGQKLRENFEKKLEKMKAIKRQIVFLDSESLDLTEEIAKLISELEMKNIYER